MTTLLVMTTGQTDVQLVMNGVRCELRKDRCAALHDELEQRRAEWHFVDAPCYKQEPPVEALPEGAFSLCTPKLDAVLCRVVPAAALLLETRRNASAAPGDPRFAGAVLKSRLETRGVVRVYRCTYLQNNERLEDPDQPLDAVVRREVVRRLEAALCNAIANVKPSRFVVTATGGFPVISNLVEEMVRLHAGELDVEVLEIADGTRATPPTPDRAVPRVSVPEPLVSFQSRRRALEQITKGNLLGAWAIVEPLHVHETERVWTQVVDWLRCFASSLPMPHGCDLQVLVHPRMAVRAALRVELALRAGDIPRAVHGTVAFCEAAVWDKLLEYFERDASNPRCLKLREGKPKPTGKLLRDGGDDDRNCHDKKNRKKNRPFERKTCPDGKQGFWFHESGTGCFAHDYVGSEPLKALHDAVQQVKQLRNDVAHNEPTPKLMAEARERMQKARLWSSEDTFLSQPLVQNVLKELGESQPDQLLECLLARVRQRLTAVVTL